MVAFGVSTKVALGHGFLSLFLFCSGSTFVPCRLTFHGMTLDELRRRGNDGCGPKEKCRSFERTHHGFSSLLPGQLPCLRGPTKAEFERHSTVSYFSFVTIRGTAKLTRSFCSAFDISNILYGFLVWWFLSLTHSCGQFACRIRIAFHASPNTLSG